MWCCFGSTIEYDDSDDINVPKKHLNVPMHMKRLHILVDDVPLWSDRAVKVQTFVEYKHLNVPLYMKQLHVDADVSIDAIWSAQAQKVYFDMPSYMQDEYGMGAKKRLEYLKTLDYEQYITTRLSGRTCHTPPVIR